VYLLQDLIVGKVAACIVIEVPEPYLYMVAEKEFLALLQPN
jgi:hypothetical protein